MATTEPLEPEAEEILATKLCIEHHDRWRGCHFPAELFQQCVGVIVKYTRADGKTAKQLQMELANAVQTIIALKHEILNEKEAAQKKQAELAVLGESSGKFLQYLDSRGGLGIETHERIREILSKTTGDLLAAHDANILTTMADKIDADLGYDLSAKAVGAWLRRIAADKLEEAAKKKQEAKRQ